MSSLPEGLSEARNVALLADPDRAREAFGQLWGMMSVRLLRTAMRAGLSLEDSEDAVLSVAAALWERRTSLAELSTGGFWAFAFRAVKNQAVDRLRRHAKVPIFPLDEDRSISSEELVYIDAAVQQLLDEESLYGAANRLWLGDDEGLGVEILALQLCIRERLTWKESAEIVGLSDDFMVSSIAARYALFASLVWSHEELTAHVLDLDQPIEGILDRFHRGERVALGRWEPTETAIAILHICHAMNSTEIKRYLKEDQEIDNVIDRIISRYPFSDLVAIALHLSRPGIDDALRHQGLWKRIVFEYHTRMQLPHKHIVERAAPAASIAGTKLSETVLNSWIGNGRLWAQFIAYLKEDQAYAS